VVGAFAVEVTAVFFEVSQEIAALHAAVRSLEPVAGFEPATC